MVHVSPKSQSSTAYAKFRTSSLLAVVLVVVSCFAGGMAHAQLSGKGEIKGTVKDPTGAVVAGATVTATEASTGITVTRPTNGDGDFDISPLDAGIYTVTVTAKGFEKQAQDNIHVDALEIANYNPVLTVGSSTEMVTVTSAPPQLQTSDAVLGATMESDLYSALPIEMGAYGSPDQRRATDVAFLMPGVQGNNTSGNPTTNTGIVNGSGSKGAVSDVYVDGVAFVRAGGNGDPRYVWTAISVDAVDQFQVQTNGYSAVYEGQGIQNYTIKAGGKALHGSVYEFSRNTILDTWGFFGPANLNPLTGKPVKPIENSNEYGINLSGPLVPLQGWRDKLFFFGNYNGFRYASANPTFITLPTTAEQQGNFQATGVNIYDPSTQAACTANSTNGPCRYQYGYGPGTGTGLAGNPTATGAPINVIPASQFSTVATNLQQFLPPLTNQSLTNNYLAPNHTGLTNWSTTDRIDYVVGPNDTVTMVAAIGRQASSNPVGQTTAGRNVGPVPYNYGQTYAPKTAVGVIEETHIFTANLLNQIKYGYARYYGPTFYANEVPQYAATAMGLTGLPAGAAQQAFPIVVFAGTDAPTSWGATGSTYPNVTTAENYTLVDNLQWIKGKHSFTFGGQIGWLLYNTITVTGGSTPLTLTTAVTETAGITPSSNASPKYAALANSGLSYASFLVGQIDKASYTQYLQQEFGSRFRAISPYVQDNWKVNSKLTLDLGVRYDFFPSVTEVHNAGSFFNPNLANPVTGLNGALEYTGNGTNTCNCSTPVSNYTKNIGPRLGLAYQILPKTVIHASYGVMFTHGGAVGGSATGLGTLGFSSALSASSNGSLLSTAPLTGTSGAVPVAAQASGASSGPAFGTGYTTTSGYTGTPSSVGYYDTYLGGRAPEFVNWTFGVQQQWTNNLTSTITYVGSEGHFLPTDGGNPRGYYADQLDPKYDSLGSNLALTGTALTTYCGANAGVCPASLSVFNTGQNLAQLLKPFPFQTVADTFGYVANANYHALQLTVNMRAARGVTFMANYTLARSIDDGGTFRSGYAIPAAFAQGMGNASQPDRLERTVSTTNQPQHLVVTGVWELPLGKTVLGSNPVERAILGGFKFSEVLQAFSGSPLALTGSSCQTNPAQITCEPTLNPAFSGPARINGHWGQGVTATNPTGPSAPQYIAPSVGSTTIPVSGPFISPVVCSTTNSVSYLPNGQVCPSSPGATLLNTSTVPAYTFGNAPRTAPYGISGPGNYQLDIALVRSIPLHITETSRLNFRAEMYNLTNHTWFGVASTAVGNASFGQVTTNANYARRAIQLSGRIEF